MANTKSAKKRVKVVKRNRLQNRSYKSHIRSLIKMFLKNLQTYKVSKTLENEKQLKKNLSLIYSAIDKSTKRRVIHKNKAARKKSQLAAYVKNA